LFSGDIRVINSSSSDSEYNEIEPEDNDDDDDDDDDYDVISVRSDIERGSSSSSIAETYGGDDNDDIIALSSSDSQHTQSGASYKNAFVTIIYTYTYVSHTTELIYNII